jgi:hypothetical protein
MSASSRDGFFTVKQQLIMAQWQDPVKQPLNEAPTAPYEAYQPYQSPQQPGAAAYPGMATGAQVQCFQTKEQLEEYLRSAGYGENQMLFNNYFVRDTNGAPLCYSCRRPIGAHPSVATMGAQVGVTGHNGYAPMMQPGAYGGQPMMTGPGITVTLGVGPARRPTNLTPRGSFDEARIGAPRGLIFAACLMSFIATIQLIAFCASGLVAHAGFVVVVPIILYGVAFLLLFLAKSTHVTIERTRGAAGLVSSTSRNFVCCCLSTTESCQIGQIVAIRVEQTSMRVNRQYLFTVSAFSASGMRVLLYRGYAFDSQQEAVNWADYLQQVKGGPIEVALSPAMVVGYRW